MGLQETLLGTPGQTQVHQTGATRPPGYGFAQDVYRTLEQLMNSGTPFPTYQGNIDPGLSPTLQNSLRMAQGYSQSSPGEALSGINGVLGRFMNPTYSNPGGGSSMPFSGQFRPNAPTYNGGRVGGYDPQMSNQTGGGLMGGGSGPGLGTDPSKPGYNPGLDYMTPMGRGGSPWRGGGPLPPGGPIEPDFLMHSPPGAGRVMPGGGNMGGGAPQYGPPKQPIQGQQNFGGGGWAPPGGQQGGTPPWAPQSQGGPPIGGGIGNKMMGGGIGNKMMGGGGVNASFDTFNPNSPMGVGAQPGGGMPFPELIRNAQPMPWPGGGMNYGNDGRAQQIPQRGPSIDPMPGGSMAGWRPGMRQPPLPMGGDFMLPSNPGNSPIMPGGRPGSGGYGSITPSGPQVDPMGQGGGYSVQPAIGSIPYMGWQNPGGYGPQSPMQGSATGGQGQFPTLSFPGGPSGQQMGPMQPPQQGGQPSVDFNNYLRSFLGQGQGGG